MKLYTEEQVKNFLKERTFLREDTIDAMCETLTPIELPSDEQIEELSKNTNFEHDYFNHGFVRGAELVKEQILKQKQ